MDFTVILEFKKQMGSPIKEGDNGETCQKDQTTVLNRFGESEGQLCVLM